MTVAALILAATLLGASDLDEFKVKREQVFEFVQKPQVTRQGDRATIAFATKGFCDVTVAVEAEGPSRPRSIGGDEVGLFYPAYLGVHTDRRLFIADPGNSRILGVKLDYHAAERVSLRDVKETE